MSGLKISLEKSELVPLGRVENVEMFAAELGCKVGRLPSTYLGLPLGACYKSMRVRDGVEERLRKRLALWKSQYISKGGRATLIKSTLFNLPTYFLSLLHIPKMVILRFEQIQRNLLWGGGRLDKKPHLVRWEIVCMDKRSGGLGVMNLFWFNKALLSKWRWRFATKRGAFWNEVIRGKYGE